MSEKVSFKLAQSNKFVAGDDKSKFEPEYKAGQIIFVIDMDNGNESGHGKIYVDFHDKRICFTPTSSGSISSGMNFIGVSTTNPSTGTVTIDDEVVTPSEGDLVAYGKKEYLYRKLNGTLGWYELGDEEEMDWNF